MLVVSFSVIAFGFLFLGIGLSRKEGNHSQIVETQLKIESRSKYYIYSGYFLFVLGSIFLAISNLMVGLITVVVLIIYIFIKNTDVYYLNFKRVISAYKENKIKYPFDMPIDRMEKTCLKYFLYSKTQKYNQENITKVIIDRLRDKDLSNELIALKELADDIITTEEIYDNLGKPTPNFNFTMELISKKSKALDKAFRRYEV